MVAFELLQSDRYLGQKQPRAIFPQRENDFHEKRED